MNRDTVDTTTAAATAASAALRESETRLMGLNSDEKKETVERVLVLYLINPSMAQILKGDILATISENSLVAEGIYRLGSDDSISDEEQLKRASSFKCHFGRAFQSGHPFLLSSGCLRNVLYDAVLVATSLRRRRFLEEIAPLLMQRVTVDDNLHYFALSCAIMMDDMELVQLWMQIEQTDCIVKRTNARRAVTAWCHIKAHDEERLSDEDKSFVRRVRSVAESSVGEMRAILFNAKQRKPSYVKKEDARIKTAASLSSIANQLGYSGIYHTVPRCHLVSLMERQLWEACTRLRKGGQRMKQVRHMCALQSVKDIVLAWLSLPEEHSVAIVPEQRVVMYDIYLLEVAADDSFPEWVKRILYINDVLARPGYVPFGVAIERLAEEEASENKI